MRMFIQGEDGNALTETWLYQYLPSLAGDQRGT